MARSRNIKSVIAVAAVLALSACGSNSDDDDSVVPSQDDPVSDTPVEADTPVVTDTPNTEPEVLTPSGDDSTLYLGANNTAVLQGPVIGTGAVPNADGVRDITVSVGSLGNGLALRSLSVFENPQDILVEYVALIENTSDQFVCEIDIIEGIIVNQEGDESRLDIDTSGSIGTLPPFGNITGYSNRCVSPGSTVFGFGNFPIDDAIEVRGDGLDPTDFDNTSFDLIVEPVSYEVQADGQIDVLIANRGNLQVFPERLDLYLLNSDGSIVGLLRGVPQIGSPTSLEPGAESIISTFSNNFAGQVSTVRAVINFRGPSRLP